MPWRRSRLLQKYAKAADHAKSAIGTGSPCGPAAPCRAAASRFHIPVFHATFVPHAIPRPLHTWAASPYGIAVSPYNHTPDVFPHMSQQIHIAGPSPHTIRKLQKSDFHFGENSGSCPTNPQPTPSSKHPEPALPSSKPIPNRFQQITRVTVQQISHQPSHANPTYLRLGGCRHLLHVRPWSCAHLHGHVHGFVHIHWHAHGHSHTFTGMCTATSTSGHAFDETSVRLEQIYNPACLFKFPAAA